MTPPVTDDVRATPDGLRMALHAALPDVTPSSRIVIIGDVDANVAGRTAALSAVPGASIGFAGAGTRPGSVRSAGALVIVVDAADGDRTANPGVVHLDTDSAGWGYTTGMLLRMLGAAGAVPAADESIRAAATVAEALLGETMLGSTGHPGVAVSLGTDLADALRHRTPVIVGGTPSAEPAALRWMHLLVRATGVAGLAVDDEGAELGSIGGDRSGPPGVVLLSDPDTPERPDAITGALTSVTRPRPMIGRVFACGTGVVARAVSLGIVGEVAAATMTGWLAQPGTPVTSMTSTDTTSTDTTPTGTTAVAARPDADAGADVVETLRDFIRSLRED